MTTTTLIALCCAALLAALLSPTPTDAGFIYFNVQEGTERCFIEEVPADTLVLAAYKNIEWDHMVQATPEETTALIFTVKSPPGEVMTTHIATKEGRFAFTSIQGGEHQVCLNTNTTSWFGTTRNFKVHLNFEVGEHARDYSMIAKQEHLSAIDVEIRKLNDKIHGIQKELNYRKKREAVFRDVSEDTNARVMWFSIAQTVVLLASGIWQLTKLKSFFKQKKLA